MEEVDGPFDLGDAGADRVVGGGNLVALEEALGEAFAGFEHGRRPRWPEDAQAALLEGIDHAQREGQLRADDGQLRLLVLDHANHRLHILQINRNAARNPLHAAIAGSADHLRHPRAAFDRPGQRVLAASRTQNQNLHRAFLFFPFFQASD